MIPLRWPLPRDPELSERTVIECMSKHCLALFQYFVAMSYEKQAGFFFCQLESSIIQRRHDRLTRSCGSYDQVLAKAAYSLQFQLVEHRSLEWIRLDSKWCKNGAVLD